MIDNKVSNKGYMKYDENNNLIYHKCFDGREFWYRYDEKGNRILYKVKVTMYSGDTIITFNCSNGYGQ